MGSKKDSYVFAKSVQDLAQAAHPKVTHLAYIQSQSIFRFMVECMRNVLVGLNKLTPVMDYELDPLW